MKLVRYAEVCNIEKLQSLGEKSMDLLSVRKLEYSNVEMQLSRFTIFPLPESMGRIGSATTDKLQRYCSLRAGPTCCAAIDQKIGFNIDNLF
jgi:hypothetical protein